VGTVSLLVIVVFVIVLRRAVMGVRVIILRTAVMIPALWVRRVARGRMMLMTAAVPRVVSTRVPAVILSRSFR
jgi:hypothetical protein